VAESVAELFEQYATAYVRGERPRAEEFLARAGADADELAELIDRYLVAAPVPSADEQTAALVSAWVGRRAAAGRAARPPRRPGREIRRRRRARRLGPAGRAAVVHGRVISTGRGRKPACARVGCRRAAGRGERRSRRPLREICLTGPWPDRSMTRGRGSCASAIASCSEGLTYPCRCKQSPKTCSA
jgi:hypothetical protein